MKGLSCQRCNVGGRRPSPGEVEIISSKVGRGRWMIHYRCKRCGSEYIRTKRGTHVREGRVNYGSEQERERSPQETDR